MLMMMIIVVVVMHVVMMMAVVVVLVMLMFGFIRTYLPVGSSTLSVRLVGSVVSFMFTSVLEVKDAACPINTVFYTTRVQRKQQSIIMSDA